MFPSGGNLARTGGASIHAFGAGRVNKKVHSWLSVFRIPRDVLAVLPLLAGAWISPEVLDATIEGASDYQEIPARALAALPLVTAFQLPFGFERVKAIHAASSWLVPLLIALPVGVLIDRTRSHALLYVGGALAVTGAVLSALALVPLGAFVQPLVPSVYTGQIISEVGFTMAGAAALVYIVRRTVAGQRGRVLGLSVGVGGLLSVVVPRAIGVAAEVVGYSAGMVFVALYTIAGIALVWRYAPVIDSPCRSIRWIRNVVYAPNRLLLVYLSDVALGVLLSVSVFVEAFSGGGGHGRIGIDVLAVAEKRISTKPMPDFDRVAFVEGGVWWSLTSLVVICAVGILADRFGRLRLLVPSVLILWLANVLAAQADSMPLLLMALRLDNLGGGHFLLIWLLIVDRIPSSRIGTAFGTLTFVSTLGPAILLLPAHAASDGLGTNGVLIIWSVAALLAVAFALRAGESAPSRRRTAAASVPGDPKPTAS